MDRSIWYLFPPDFVLVDKVTVIPRTVFVGVRLCHRIKGSTAESKFIMFLGVNWFLQQHLLYSCCKRSHNEMASWLCHFMGSFLRELPRSASCMQGTLLFLFRFFDTVTSHYYLPILLSVSQQRGLRSNPSIFTIVELSVAQENTLYLFYCSTFEDTRIFTARTEWWSENFMLSFLFQWQCLFLSRPTGTAGHCKNYRFKGNLVFIWAMIVAEVIDNYGYI